MKLYYAPGACSLSPHIALLELGFTPELVRVDTKTKKTEDGRDFNQINSKGYVPAFETDKGELLTEGPAIVQYIADLKPASKLAPAAGTMERVHLQEWLGFINSELHKNFGALFYPNSSADWREAAIANLKKRFAWVAEQLQGKQYLMGDQFTVADGYLFTILGWCAFVKFDLSPWPVLQAFQARVAQRPAVQAAMKAEGLIK